jgi:hypothetical protein
MPVITKMTINGDADLWPRDGFCKPKTPNVPILSESKAISKVFILLDLKLVEILL